MNEIIAVSLSPFAAFVLSPWPIPVMSELVVILVKSVLIRGGGYCLSVGWGR
jgi:hypothetical protein